MSFIRTEQQEALNNLLVAMRETNDHYRDSLELVNEDDVKKILQRIAQQRETFVARLEQAVREVGDLPAVPDPDREAGAMLLHHVTALLKDDVLADVLKQRADGERNLASLVAEAQKLSLAQSHHVLLDDVTRHVSLTLEQLESFHKSEVE